MKANERAMLQDEKQHKTADELNIDVRTLKEDGDMDTAWRGRSPHLPENFEIDERSLNQIIHKSRDRIETITEGEDLATMLYFDDDYIMERHKPVRQPAQDRYAGLQTYTPSPQGGGRDYSFLTEGTDGYSGGWVVEAAVATTKKYQKKINVWVVRESETGVQYPTPFKEEAVANTLADTLNHYGDIRHPAVKGIVEAYNTRERVLKDAKKLSQAVKGGNTSMRSKLDESINTLRQLDQKLGL